MIVNIADMLTAVLSREHQELHGFIAVGVL